MAEGDFQPVDAVYGGVAGRSAPQGRDFGVWHKPHMHQVVLDILWQIEGDKDPAFTDRQIAEQAHLTNSESLAVEAGSGKYDRIGRNSVYGQIACGCNPGFGGILDSSIPMT